MNAQVQLSGKDRAGRKTDKYVSQDICNMLDQKRDARKKKELDIHYIMLCREGAIL